MNVAESFRVEHVTWADRADDLAAVRRTVFVAEQGVPAELEWDGLDPTCHHVLAVGGDGRAIGTGRLLPDGHIGRMAVLKPWRRRGVGAAMLAALVQRARVQGHDTLVLNAQVRAVGFYRLAGFETVGSEFLEAGIPHVEMHRKLDAISDAMRR